MNKKSMIPPMLPNQASSPTPAGNDSHYSVAPMQEPWSKWVEMQQQLMAADKGAQSALKKAPQQGSHQGQWRTG